MNYGRVLLLELLISVELELFTSVELELLEELSELEELPEVLELSDVELYSKELLELELLDSEDSEE